jgi:hypothetical protein
MFRAFRFVLMVGVVLAISAAAQADPVTWDILNENYGNGSGQVSFLGAYDPAWSADLTETLVDGKAVVHLSAATGLQYQVKPAIAGMATGTADFTLEFKLGLPAKTLTNFYLSDTNSSATASWNHVLVINGTYGGPQPDALQDYNLRTTDSQAPLGFDGGVDHVYRLVREAGTTKLYLDNNGTPVFSFLNQSAGAAADHVNLILGFGPTGSEAADANFGYLKIANGAYAPTPEPSALVLLMTSLVGLIAYAWRKRR